MHKFDDLLRALYNASNTQSVIKMAMDTQPAGTGPSDEGQQIWDQAAQELDQALEAAARSGHLLSYSDAASAVHNDQLTAHSAELVTLLCRRMTHDVEAGLPLLPSIVIGRWSNRPGGGFFRFARQYFQFDDDEVFWLSEVEAVHDYYSARSRRRDKAANLGHRIRITKPVQTVDMNETDFILSFFD